MESVEFDITRQLDTFNKLASSMDYIISKSLNDVAFKNARKDISKEIHKKMEVRNKVFAGERSIRINKSSKNDLQITLYHFKEQMGLQQFGGTEFPKSKTMAIPIRKNLATYAGVQKDKKIPKSLSIPVIMNKAPHKKGEAIYKTKGIEPFVLKRGVFVRTGNGLRMLYSFADKATHNKKLLKFQKTIEHTYNVKLERNIEKNYLRILKG
jgi:hypothetical protein